MMPRFHQARYDSTLFYKFNSGETLVILAYIDDLLLTGTNLSSIVALKK